MTALLILLSVVLITVIAIQIGKVSELATKIRGEEEMQDIINRRQAGYMILFMVVFLAGVVISGAYYKNWMLGFGPHASASEHGGQLDMLFKWTLVVTGIVFVATQIMLFYFAFKYRARRGETAAFISHNDRLEVIWTIIPAIVMTFLVVSGLDAWNTVMADLTDEEDYMEIEATGFQFGWNLRYPGADGLLGEKNFKLISGTNPLGQNWKDEKNLDDFHPGEIVLPKGKKIRVRITAQDVLHNFYLPHFRVKMDAVPGMPTYFVFTPMKTTDEYRQELSNYPEYNVPADPKDPETKMLWEVFDYELACAELCGRGHYSMRRLVRIVEQDEFDAWQAQQQSYYFSNVRGKEDDPWKGRVFEGEQQPATDTTATESTPMR
ncbi:MAG: cytochrome c oxidase subunit II [Haliscomenobacter sp.]